MGWLETIEGSNIGIDISDGYLVYITDTVTSGGTLDFDISLNSVDGYAVLYIDEEEQTVSEGSNSIYIPGKDSTGDGLPDVVSVEWVFSDPSTMEIGALNVNKYTPDTEYFYSAHIDENFNSGCLTTWDDETSRYVGENCFDEDWDVVWDDGSGYVEYSTANGYLDFLLGTPISEVATYFTLSKTGLNIQPYDYVVVYVSDLTYRKYTTEFGSTIYPEFYIGFYDDEESESPSYELNYLYDISGDGDAPIRSGYPLTLALPDIGDIKKIEIVFAVGRNTQISGNLHYFRLVSQREGCFFPINETFNNGMFAHNWMTEKSGPAEIVINEEMLEFVGDLGYAAIYCDNLALTSTHVVLKVSTFSEQYTTATTFRVSVYGTLPGEFGHFYFVSPDEKIFNPNEVNMGVGEHIIFLDNYSDFFPNGATITKIEVFADFSADEGEPE